MGKAGAPLFENSEIISMFPTLVWKLQLPAAFHAPLDARMLTLLVELRGASPLAPGQGWQSESNLQERKWSS